mgnify:CR=1 FL=1
MNQNRILSGWQELNDTLPITNLTEIVKQCSKFIPYGGGIRSDGSKVYLTEAVEYGDKCRLLSLSPFDRKRVYKLNL